MQTDFEKLARDLRSSAAQSRISSWIHSQLRDPDGAPAMLEVLSQYSTQHPQPHYENTFHHIMSRLSMYAGARPHQKTSHLFALNVLVKHAPDTRLGLLTSTANLQQLLAQLMHPVIKEMSAPLQASQFTVFPVPVPTEMLSALPAHQLMEFLHHIQLWIQNKPLPHTINLMAQLTSHLSISTPSLQDYTLIFAFNGPASLARTLHELLPFADSFNASTQLHFTLPNSNKLALSAMVIDIGTPWVIAHTCPYSAPLYNLMHNQDPHLATRQQISCGFHQTDPTAPVRANLALLQDNTPLCVLHLPCVTRPDLLDSKVWALSNARKMATPLIHSSILPLSIPETLAYTPKGWQTPQV